MKQIVLSFIFILCIACSNSNPLESAKEFKINRNSVFQLPEQSPFTSIRLVQIASAGKWFLSSFAKVMLFDNSIYIFDDKSAVGKRIFVINLDGRILKILDRSGEGPGEYLSITDFDIDKKRSLVYVVDQMKHHILVYNMSFDYVYKIKPDSDVPFNLITYNEETESFLLGKGNGRLMPEFNYSILKMDRSGKILNKYFPYEIVISSQFGGPWRMSEMLDKVDYLPGYSNSIYRIDRDSTYEAYRFVFQEPNLTYNDFRATRETGNCIFNQSFIESKKYLIFRWMYNDDSYFTMVNKETGKTNTYKNTHDPSCNCGSSIRFINFIDDDKVVLEANNMNIRHILSLMDSNNERTLNSEILGNLSGESDLNEQILLIAELKF